MGRATREKGKTILALYLWNAEDEKNSTRAMIQEMEQLASEPSFEPHKIEGTEARDDDMLMRVDVELSSVKLHVHFLTSSVMNISFEKLQTLLTYRRKYVRFSHDFPDLCHHTHTLTHTDTFKYVHVW